MPENIREWAVLDAWNPLFISCLISLGTGLSRFFPLLLYWCLPTVLHGGIHALNRCLYSLIYHDLRADCLSFGRMLYSAVEVYLLTAWTD